MEIIDYVKMSKDRYTSQFDDDPVFDAIVQTIIEYKMNVQGFTKDYAMTMFDIDKATGKNLDLIGSIVGQPRELVDFFTKPYFGFKGNPKATPFDEGEWYSIYSNSGGDSRILVDSEYRLAIKARIYRNNTNCSRREIIKILATLCDINPDSRNLLPDADDTSKTIQPFIGDDDTTLLLHMKDESRTSGNIIQLSQLSASGNMVAAIMNRKFKVKTNVNYTVSFKSAGTGFALKDGKSTVSYSLNLSGSDIFTELDTPITSDIKSFTQVQKSFTVDDPNDQEVTVDLMFIVIFPAGFNGEAGIFYDLQIVEEELGMSNIPQWEKSAVDLASIVGVEEPAHGEIVVRLNRELAPDYLTYFLSRVESENNLIPRPLGYKFSTELKE